MYCITASVIGLVNVYLIAENVTLNKLPQSPYLSPSQINNTRFNFLTFCCFMIPLGWLLGNILLYLYFKSDDGYFNTANIEFQYNNGFSLNGVDERINHLKKAFKSLKRCCKKSGTQDIPDSRIKEEVETMTSSEKSLKGHWTDLNGQETFIMQRYLEKYFFMCSVDWSIEDLEESEKMVFYDIKQSFGYYQNMGIS